MLAGNLHRRIAQWQSASTHTEEAAAFDSCSAYQDSRPHILFLSHCVPNPPNKGEKIRAHYELRALAEHFEVHLACFARDEAEVADAYALRSVCASVYAERFSSKKALLRAGVKFGLGACLNKEYYSSSTMRSYVAGLARRVRFHASFVYTAVMMPYAPVSTPIALDMVDVDSEKWQDYTELRRPAYLYRAEAKRLRAFETDCAQRADVTLLTTENEAGLLRNFVPGASIISIENGVDCDFFKGQFESVPADLLNRSFIVFLGSMDYHPNVQAVEQFARSVFPELRERVSDLEFFIVGRHPSARVRQLGKMEGITVTGTVPDVRPYMVAARAVIAPLRVARGVQNKVLEALAMGRKVFASDAVCRTFGTHLPIGVVPCDSETEFVNQLEREARQAPHYDSAIHERTQTRFSWGTNMIGLSERLQRMGVTHNSQRGPMGRDDRAFKPAQVRPYGT